MDVEQDERKGFSCKLCAVQLYSKLQLALHEISGEHIRRLKKQMLKNGFLANCLACSTSLSDLKQTEAHVQKPVHKYRLDLLSKQGHFSNRKFTCLQCGLSFFHEVALEVHKAMPSHGMAITPASLPNVNELVKQLNGLPTGMSELTNNYSCIICNEDTGGLEDFLLHLFSTSHISCLRASSCVICKKDFIHTSDREAHLSGSKHQANLERTVQNHLKNGEQYSFFWKKRGFMCMYCMIWCNSWSCFELHLLDITHSEVVKRRKSNQAKCATSSCNVSLSERMECQVTLSCEGSTIASWRRWREEPAGLSGWCHICGVALPCPGTAESHLEDHRLERIPLAGMAHASPFSQASNVGDVFGCRLCTLSFRSTFSLMVHEALPQHHLRTGPLSGTNIPRWCVHCGLQLVDEVCSKFVKRKVKEAPGSHSSSEFVMKMESPFKICTESLKPCSGLYNSDNSSKVLLKEEKGLENAELCSPPSMPGNCNLREDEKIGILLEGKSSENPQKISDHLFETRAESEAVKSVESDNNLTRALIATSHRSICSSGFVQDKSKETEGSTVETASVYDSRVPNSNRCSETVTTTAHKSVASVYGGSAEKMRPALPSMLDQCKQNNGKSSDISESTQVTDTGFPVVAAAIIAPSESLQTALQSVMTLVSEALSATLSTHIHHKRKSRDEGASETLGPDTKRVQIEKILEAALQRGLQSVTSCLSSNCDVTSTKSMDMNGSLPQVTESCNQHQTSEAETLDRSHEVPDGTTVQDIKSFPDKSGCGLSFQSTMDPSVSLVSTNNLSGSSLVVAAAIVSHLPVPALADKRNEKLVNCSPKTRQEESAKSSMHLNDQDELDKTTVDIHDLDRSENEIQLCSSVSASKILSEVGDGVDLDRAEIKQIEVEASPLQRERYHPCLQPSHPYFGSGTDFKKQDANNGHSPSSTDNETESDSDGYEPRPFKSHLQVDNDALLWPSIDSDNSDSESDSDQ